MFVSFLSFQIEDFESSTCSPSRFNGHSKTRAKSAHLVTLETKMNTPSKYYHTYKRINK